MQIAPALGKAMQSPGLAQLIERCRTMFGAVLGMFIPAGTDASSEKANEVGRLLFLALLAAAAVPCFVIEFALFELWGLSISLSLAAVLMIGSPWIYKATGRIAVAREAFLTSLFAFKLFESVYFSSVISPGSMWFMALPVIAILMGSIRSGAFWLTVGIASPIGLYAAYEDRVNFLNAPGIPSSFLYTFSLVVMVFAISTYVLMVDYGRRQALGRLKEANETVRNLAIRDPLTGAFNRRHIWDTLRNLEHRVGSADPNFSIILVDIDKFKDINDKFGHQVGDAVIKSVSDVIASQMNGENCFGRYGGEEFICLIKSENCHGAEFLAEKIRRHVAASVCDETIGLTRVTVSIGTADVCDGESFDATIARADLALYAAKRAGRDCVRIGRPQQQGAQPELSPVRRDAA